MNNEIQDNATYEWGILTQTSAQESSVEAQQFSPTKYGNWQGGALSWRGDQFRSGNKRRIKTFADFQRINPLNLPTNKTFRFYRVELKEQGFRERVPVHEGTFSEPPRRSSAGTLGDQAVSADTHLHQASYEARTLRETMERTINNMERELEICRRENTELRTRLDEATRELRENRDKIINIEGERIRFSVEKDALIESHRREVEALKADHEREIEKMNDEFDRELEDARKETELSTRQSLNDGMSGFDKLMDVVSKNADKLPKILEMASGASDLLKAMSGGNGIPMLAPQPTPSSTPSGQPQAESAPLHPYGLIPDNASEYTTADEDNING